MKNQCRSCNQEFETDNIKKIYCSPICRTKFHNLNNKIAKEEILCCKGCDKQFLANAFVAKRTLFCSANCRKKYLYQQQNSERKKQVLIMPSKTCLNCNSTFESNSIKTFCLERCKEIYHTKNKKEGNKECPNCDKIYEPSNLRQKFCCNECKIEFHKNAKLEKLRKIAENDPESFKKCHFCKKEFQATGSNRKRQNFCSNQCNINNNAANQRKERKEIRQTTIKICLICNESFNPSKTLKEVYCSNKCAKDFRKRIYSMMERCYENTNTSKADHSHEVLGYSPNQLIEHIQKFPNWNEIKNDSWHLDHIFPVIAFIKRKITDISIICALDNLQPLSGSENQSKSDSYDEQAFETWLNSKQSITI